MVFKLYSVIIKLTENETRSRAQDQGCWGIKLCMSICNLCDSQLGISLELYYRL